MMELRKINTLVPPVLVHELFGLGFRKVNALVPLGLWKLTF